MDIWRSGIVRARLDEIIAAGSLAPFEVQWLPQPAGRFRFIADPFGVVRGGSTYVFVETLDYRNRRGRIEVLTYNERLELVDRATCLAEPWHLSYPVPITGDDGDYLLPEAHRSGGLTLYRATDFPRAWERAASIELPHLPVDATPLFRDGRWWIFYSAAGDSAPGLHLALADQLTGPWRAHPLSPLPIGPAGSRPGGTPIEHDDEIILPVQDCSTGYGIAIRPLHITRLTPEELEWRLGPPIKASLAFSPFTDGLHTLSECGDITLFDVKRIDRSLAARAVGLLGKARRAYDRSRLRSGRTVPR